MRRDQVNPPGMGTLHAPAWSSQDLLAFGRYTMPLGVTRTELRETPPSTIAGRAGLWHLWPGPPELGATGVVIILDRRR